MQNIILTLHTFSTNTAYLPTHPPCLFIHRPTASLTRPPILSLTYPLSLLLARLSISPFIHTHIHSTAHIFKDHLHNDVEHPASKLHIYKKEEGQGYWDTESKRVSTINMGCKNRCLALYPGSDLRVSDLSKIPADPQRSC